MSHGHTVIEPARGLTVLIGPNNCGKSAVVAALQILCHNENSTYVLRHDAKKCRVTVTTDDGAEIVWRRGKSGGPAYEINGKTYDRLKTAGQPDELASVLKLPKVSCDRHEIDIHFGEQKSPVFLVGDSARTAADFFASSSDAGRLMKMQFLHKQKVRDAKRERKVCTDSLDDVNEQLQKLEAVTDLDHEYQACCQLGAEVASCDQDILDLQRLVSRIEQKVLEYRKLDKRQQCLSQLPPLPTWEPADELERPLMLLRQLIGQKVRLQRERECLVALELPPVMGDELILADLVERLRTLLARCSRYSSLDELLAGVQPPPKFESDQQLQGELDQLAKQCRRIGELDATGARLAADLAETEVAVREWIERNPNCPTCGSDLDPEQWLDCQSHLSAEGEHG